MIHILTKYTKEPPPPPASIPQEEISDDSSDSDDDVIPTGQQIQVINNFKIRDYYSLMVSIRMKKFWF